MKPLLYDHLSRPIEKKSISNLDPNFWRSPLNATNSFSARINSRPYEFHSWVYAIIRRISDPIISLPRVLYRVNEPDELIDSHPILNLMESPNPLMCGDEFWESIILSLCLSTKTTPGGQCFIYGESGIPGKPFDFRSGKLPLQLWPYTDNTIQPRKVGDTFVGWKMVVNGVEIMQFEFHEIIRIRFVNPYDPTKGLSPYAPSSAPVTQDGKADEFNTNYFDNNGAVGGVLTTENDTISPSQLKEMRDAFDEMHSGAGNAGKTAALAYGLTYEQFLQNNRDMQFIEQRKDNRQRIQAAYGVNQEEIGIYDSGLNRATADQADRSVWEKTRLPLLRRIWNAFNYGWFRWVEDGKLRGKSDLSNVEALREDITAKIANAEKLKNMNLPPAEALRLVNLPVDTTAYPYLEKSFVPMSLVDIELLAATGMIGYPTDGDEPEPDEDDDGGGKKEFSRSTEERDRQWEAYITHSLDPGEKSMYRVFEKFFYALRNEMQDKVDAWSKMQPKAFEQKGFTVDPSVFLFDLKAANEEIVRIYGPQTRAQMKREWSRIKKLYPDKIKWKINESTMQRFIDQRKDKLFKINNLTFENARTIVAETVAEGIKNNLTPGELAKAIKKNVGELSRISIGRAKVIARTEVGAITGRARFATYYKSGITRHEWVTAKDERVRDSHRIDSEERDIGSYFSNGLLYPHEPNAPAGEVINCRCFTVPVFGDK